MAKPSATTFVVGYSVVLLALFVTFSILMSKVNPDRMFYEDEVSTDPSVARDPPDSDSTGDEVPVTPETGRLLHYARRSSDDGKCFSLLNVTTDNDTDYVKDNNTHDVPTKEYLGKERRSLKDPSSVLDQLGIVILEVADEEGQPRIEVLFHPKRTLIKKTKTNSGTNNIRKSYGKAKTRKGLVTELTDNSVIKIMPDNTVVLENSNVLVSEENASQNLNAEVSSTVVEPALLPTETSDVFNTTVESVAVIDKSPKKVASFKVGVRLETTDEKPFEDTETIETTTDETFERTTNINDALETDDIKSSKIKTLSETIDSNAFESNNSITAIYNYDLETIITSENYNNTETTDVDNFDANDTIATGFTTEDTRSSTQTIDKQTLEDTYTTAMDDMNFEVLNSNNNTIAALNNEVNDTIKAIVNNADDSNVPNYEIINTIELLADVDNFNKNGTITKVSDIFETEDETVTSEAKAPLQILDSETFETDSITDTTTANTFGDILKTAIVEPISNAETSKATDSSLQNMETTTNKVESTLDLKNPLKVLPLIDNATNAAGNTVDNPTTNSHVTAKFVSNSFEGYSATETIFNSD